MMMHSLSILASLTIMALRLEYLIQLLMFELTTMSFDENSLHT